MINTIRLFTQQLKSVFQLLIVSVKHKKDFLIFETYSFNEARKIGEFTFSPSMIFVIGGLAGSLLVMFTMLIIQVTPIGYALLSHQKHPLEDDFTLVAQRVQVLSDSLSSSNYQLEQFKLALRTSNKNAPADQSDYLANSSEYDNEEFTDSFVATDFFTEDNLLLYASESRVSETEPKAVASLMPEKLTRNEALVSKQSALVIPFRIEFHLPN